MKNIPLFALLLVVCLLAIALFNLRKSFETFETLQESGLPLVLLDNVMPKKQMYFTEMNGNDIQSIVKLASPSSSIVELLKKLNTSLQAVDPFTYKVPFRVVHKLESNGITTLTIYREGKMYGFLVDYNNVSGEARATGFIPEQDINMYQGMDDDVYRAYPLNSDLTVVSKEETSKIMEQQASAIYQDRGIRCQKS
jgi:hypothetical protein